MQLTGHGELCLQQTPAALAQAMPCAAAEVPTCQLWECSEGVSDPQGPAERVFVMGERVLTEIPKSTGKAPLTLGFSGILSSIACQCPD